MTWQADPVTGINVVDEWYFAVSPAVAAARLGRLSFARALWPDLALSISEYRGLEGIRLLVHAPWKGTAEIWLEACGDGVIVHTYLRVTPPRPEWATPRRLRREAQRRSRYARRVLWCTRDILERDRRPGEPAVAGPA